MNIVLHRVIEKESQLDHILSSRSVLYNLEPIGSGTPYVESLTSYISRLANAHNVSVSSLIKGLIAKTTDKVYLKNSLSEGIFGDTAKYINGNSRLSIEYVDVLELLTSRNDLNQLTMNSWTGIFSGNVVGDYRKWCPSCLNECKSNSKDIHEPLIWYISGIDKCEKHENMLKKACPSCNKKLPFIHSHFVVGYCQYCFTWLGDDLPRKITKPLPELESFIMENYKLLIEKSFSATSLPTKKSISLALSKVMNSLKISNTNFAKLIGVGDSTLSSWLHNRSIPSKDNLIRVARTLNCNIFDLIMSENMIEKISVDKQILSDLHKSYKRGDYVSKSETKFYIKNELTSDTPRSIAQLASKKGFSPQSARDQFPSLCKQLSARYAHYQRGIWHEKIREIEGNLKFELTREIPLSLAEFHEKYGYTPSTVRRYFPELCGEIVLRYKEYKQKLKLERIENVKKEIKNITLEIHDRGVYPNRKLVQKNLKQPAIFRNPIYRDYWRGIVLSLGYNL
ncbi:TniQ family protein [Aquibacillus halophilus]|uniref:TniQ family protein n=1 Tax=Aquibacillus halophilus TaxID=930132 RepID=UPI001478A075